MIQAFVQYVFLLSSLNISEISGPRGVGSECILRKYICSDKCQGFSGKAIHLPVGQSHVPRTLKILTEKMENFLQGKETHENRLQVIK